MKRAIITLLLLLALVSVAGARSVTVITGSGGVTGGTEIFGHNATETSHAYLITGTISCSALDVLDNSGTLTTIELDSACSNCASGGLDVKIGIYSDDSGTPNAKVVGEMEFLNVGDWTRTWKSFTMNQAITAATVWICVEVSSGGDFDQYYVAGAANSRRSKNNSYGDAWPASFGTPDSSSTAVVSRRGNVSY